MINFAKAIMKPRRLVERSWNLYRLSHEGHHITGSLADAVKGASKQVLSLEEKSWIYRIEHLRTSMNSSSKPITRIDYGAGGPDSTRTEAEMLAGVQVADSLSRISQVASKSAHWCLVLFKLIRTLQPSTCIEMGTAVGMSAAYQGAALKLNGHGNLLTLEGDPSLADIAKDNFEQLGLDTVKVVVGRFQNTLPDSLKNWRPVDYVFVDGHHDGPATLAYFQQIFPFLSETAVLIFDDIAWSDGMKRAWRAISSDRRIAIAVDFGAVGLCVVDRSIAGPRYFSIPLG